LADQFQRRIVADRPGVVQKKLAKLTRASVKEKAGVEVKIAFPVLVRLVWVLDRKSVV